jgi:NAD(P)-dependent dehydrogenase (short-subunit alcohol dehydrogenase family)
MYNEVMKKNKIKYLTKHVGNLDGKTAVVTGGTGAIGREIVNNLLEMNCKVIAATLTAEEGAAFRASYPTEQQERIEILPLDLSDTASIDKLVAVLSKRDINFLINNAGVISTHPGRCYDINFLGTLRLTIKLTPILNKHENSRVVFQTSFSYHMAKIDWADPRSEKLTKKLSIYSRSKLLLNLGVTALKQGYLADFPNVKYILAHPGAVASDIMGKAGKFAKGVSKLFLHSAWTGSLGATIACVKDVPDNKLLGPWSMGIWGRPRMKRLNKKLNNKIDIENVQKILDEQIK